MIDPIEIETSERKPKYKGAYVVLALGALTIAFHYLVAPHIWAYYGI